MIFTDREHVIHTSTNYLQAPSPKTAAILTRVTAFIIARVTALICYSTLSTYTPNIKGVVMVLVNIDSSGVIVK